MNEEAARKLDNFSNALERFSQAFAETGYALSLDGTIQRFKFTFEMAWKTIKKFLFDEGIEATTARDCIKKAYKYKYIDNEKVWLDILADRNVSSHVYDESQAQEIYQHIKNSYMPEFQKLKTFLESKLAID
ncbi:MAG: nucleotidyltransferase substrate binding protein [Elusimicrobia bacterium]|nr:nucleotidyltransferase substrate binding protein [Elusimicrobiota bacterium]